MFSELVLRLKGYISNSAIEHLKMDKSRTPEERVADTIGMFKETSDYFSLFLQKLQNKNFVEKKDIQENYDFILENYAQKTDYIGRTSGSSGHPLTFRKSKFSHSVTWALIKHRYDELNVGLEGKEARFYGMPDRFFGRQVQLTKDKLLGRVRFNTRELGEKSFNKTVHSFARNRFDYIFGYARAILEFGEFLKSEGISITEICPTLKVVILTGEMSTIEERMRLESILNLPVYSEYGCSEFGYIGIEINKGVWRVNPRHLFVESDSDGALLITDLVNKSFPFVRYRLGDFGEVSRDDQGYQIITDLKGRINDVFYLPDGQKSHTMSFYYIMKSSQLFVDEVLQFQITKRKNLFIFDLVVKNERVPSEYEVKKMVCSYFNISSDLIDVEIRTSPFFTKTIIRKI